ncbi:MAG TPA: hypothetical protein DSN98_08330 [Thermoplasmata archaeon]|jgi:thymidylate synthase|nr:MAG TPA: hypothetical protein DSN98_08330 [Thermoplasmata archaeon]
MGYKGNDFNSIYKSIARRLLYNPEYIIQNKKKEILHEIIDASFSLYDPVRCFATIRNMSFTYLTGEIHFYVGGSPFLKDIACYSKFWEKVTDDGRTINSNYGKLLLHDRNHHNYTQFEYARDMLLKNKDSKKAVMTIYSRENAHASNDNPCTMYLQFFIRPRYDGKDKLDIYVKMRSSDIWFGLPYDVPFFVLIHHMMWNELKKTYPDLLWGIYHHQAGSMHLYERNTEKLKECLCEGETPDDFEKQESLFKEIIEPYSKGGYKNEFS